MGWSWGRGYLTMVGGGSMLLGAGLGGQGEGELLAAGLSDDGLDLVDGVGAVLELGNVEALLLNLVLALDLGDGDGLGDAGVGGGGVGQLALLLVDLGDEGDLVGLGLVLLTAVLMLTVSVAGGAVAGGVAGGHLHGLGLLGVGLLDGGAGGDNVIPVVLVSADLTVDDLVGLLAHGQHLVEAVVLVNHDLDVQDDGGHLVGEGGHADLGVDGGVGVPAVVLRGVAGGVVGCVGGSQGQHGAQYQVCLQHRDHISSRLDEIIAEILNSAF